jgi:uncharacterized protein (DUF736 family)
MRGSQKVPNRFQMTQNGRTLRLNTDTHLYPISEVSKLNTRKYTRKRPRKSGGVRVGASWDTRKRRYG